jgi:hypothetical protein
VKTKNLKEERLILAHNFSLWLAGSTVRKARRKLLTLWWPGRRGWGEEVGVKIYPSKIGYR